MSKRWLKISWVTGGSAGLALAIWFLWATLPTPTPVPSPAVVRAQNFPAAFQEKLQKVREEVRTRGNDPEAVRILAHLYQANRLLPEARACYQIIRAAPGGLSARDHYYLADIAQHENDLAGAQLELQAVLLTEPRYIPARLSLAESFFKSGREEEAEKEYSVVLATDASQPQALLGLARIDLQRGEEDSAVTRLEELVASHPGSAAGVALFAKILERRGETDRAIALGQLCQQKPEPPLADPWLNALLADCFEVQRLSLSFEEYFKNGLMDEALPLLERLKVIEPNGPMAKFFAGITQARVHEDATAVRDFNEALRRGGDPEKICPHLVNSLLVLGKESEASSLLADNYAKMPDSIPLAKAYATVAAKLGDEKLLRTLLKKVLRQEPYLQAQNMSLAQILWTTGERDAAAQCLQRIATVYANDVPSRALLGEYYLGKSDPFSAIKPLEQAIGFVAFKTPEKESLTVSLSTAYHFAGNREHEKEHFAEAAAYFEKASQLVPTDLNAYAGQANAWVQLRQLPRAIAALEKIAALQPANPTVQISLGDLSYQNGNAAQARRYWTQALQLTAAGDAVLRNALADRLAGRITAETFK